MQLKFKWNQINLIQLKEFASQLKLWLDLQYARLATELNHPLSLTANINQIDDLLKTIHD